MKTVKKLIYNGKEANLILLDDNITIDVVYNNKSCKNRLQEAADAYF